MWTPNFGGHLSSRAYRFYIARKCDLGKDSGMRLRGFVRHVFFLWITLLLLQQTVFSEPPKRSGKMVELGPYGVLAEAYLSLPDTPPTGGIVIIHEKNGLNQSVKNWGDFWAANGFVALAVDFYDGKVPSTPEAAEKMASDILEKGAMRIVQSAVRFLKEEPLVKVPKVGVMGLKSGGDYAVLAAAQTPLDACVVMDGSVSVPPETFGFWQTPFLGVFARRNTNLNPGAIQALKLKCQSEKIPFELHEYDAENGFLQPDNKSYEHKKAQDAIKKAHAFFKQRLSDTAVTLFSPK